MTVPHAHQQLEAFNAAYHEPVDVTSQVTRMPGTADAACLCFGDDRSALGIASHGPCLWPFCTCWKPTEEDE